MFSKISQLGKTFADEINRINDEVSGPSTNGQNQIADPAVAKRIIQTPTPDVEELDKPEDLQKDNTDETPEASSDVETSNGEESNLNGESGESATTKQIQAKSTTEPVVPGTAILVSSLQPEIRSRINKYLKYEKKYPQLYEAYRIEKKKTALIKAFENMMQEKTPCSSIGELNSMRDYLSSLENKNELLNTELAKVTKEKKEKDEQSTKLQAKVSDLQKTMTSKNSEYMTEKRSVQKELKEMKIQLTNAEGKIEKLLSEQDANKKEIEDLLDQIKQLQDTPSDSEKLSLLEKEIEDLKENLTVSENQNTKLNENIEVLESDKANLEEISTNQEEKSKSQAIELQAKIKELENSLESSQKLNETLKQKCDELSKQSKQVIVETPVVNTETTSKSKGSKKKKGKKQQAQQQPAVTTENKTDTKTDPETTTANSSSCSDIIELNHRLEETETKYQAEVLKSTELNQKLKTKFSEVEELRDMLRNVGDSLVESQKDNKESNDLMKQLESTQMELESRKSDLEILRIQNSDAVRDYEQTKISLSKKLEDCTQKVKDLQESVNQKDTEIQKLESTNQDLSSKITDLEGLLSKLKESEIKYKREIEGLITEKERLTKEVNTLQSNSNDFNTNKTELENLKIELSRKERSLNEAENKIKFLQEDKSKINDSLIELKVQNKEFALHDKTYKETTEKLTSMNEKLKTQVNDNTLRINKLVLENTKLVKELEEMTDQYNDIKHLKSSSNDQVESLKKRADELSMRNREYENRIDMIQEELTQSRNLLQERTREMSTLRKMMMENDEAGTSEQKKLKLKLDKLEEEKEKIENSSLAAIKKKQKEADELKKKQEILNAEIEELKQEKQSLLVKIQESHNNFTQASDVSFNDQYSGSNEYNDKIIESLRESLSKTEARLKELEGMNTKLRTANQESSDKLVYLNKKYKLLSQQYRKNSLTPSRNNSVTGLSARNMSISSSNSGSTDNLLHPDVQNSELTQTEDKEDIKEKSIYIKNVLMGYLEHKEQRQMLLPVVKALLFMSEEESKKMTELLV